MDEPLLPCPFCGSEAEIVEKAGGGVSIRCGGGTCYLDGAGFSLYATREKAFQDWNERRAVLSPIARTEIERVRDEMRATQLTGERALQYYAAWPRDWNRWLAALDSVLGAESTKEGM